MNRRCIALLGGSFDPVHNAHVALADYFAKLLFPDELRIIPAGNPWQKQPLQASAEHRVAMLRLAFGGFSMPVSIDTQELLRQGPSYTVDTLRTIRAEVGPEASVMMLVGADQLQRLHTWHGWRQLFDHAHVCAASRPGFGVETMDLAPEVAHEIARRTATPDQIRATPHGLMFFAANLAIDVSSTQIRTALHSGDQPDSLIPHGVLDYIKQHHLYRN
jgi:nicotinate-nucleotide adenylyltransferase